MYKNYLWPMSNFSGLGAGPLSSFVFLIVHICILLIHNNRLTLTTSFGLFFKFILKDNHIMSLLICMQIDRGRNLTEIILMKKM